MTYEKVERHQYFTQKVKSFLSVAMNFIAIQPNQTTCTYLGPKNKLQVHPI